MRSIYCFADINDCETGNHHCDSNAFCNNTTLDEKTDLPKFAS